MRKWVSLLTMVLVAAFLAACGSGGGNSNNVQPAYNLTTVSDAPVPGVLSAKVTISAVNLISGNTTVSLMPNPETVELSSLGGTRTPLILQAVPQGVYTGATVTVSSASLTYLSGGQPTSATATISNGTATLNFAAPLTVATSSASNLHLEFDLANSFSLSNGAVTFTPVIISTTGSVIAQLEESRRLELIGPLTAVGASSISVQAGDSGQSFTFTVDSGTLVEGGVAISTIPVGSPVFVYGRTQPDGTLQAKLIAVLETQAENSSSDGGEGLITSIVCNNNASVPCANVSGVVSVTSFNMVVRRSWHPDNIGKIMTVNVGSTTTFKAGLAAQFAGDTTTFDGTQIFPGQAVWTVGSVSSPLNMNARVVVLSHQGFLSTLAGAVAGTSPNYTFSVNVNASAPFLMLSGHSTASVATNNNTLYAGTVNQSSFGSTASGTTMIVRGFGVCTSTPCWPGTTGNAQGAVTFDSWKVRGF